MSVADMTHQELVEDFLVVAEGEGAEEVLVQVRSLYPSHTNFFEKRFRDFNKFF